MRKRTIRGAAATTPTPEMIRRPLTARQLARLLNDAGGGTEISAEMIRAHIARGAPADARGRMSLLAYAAWLIEPGRPPSDSGDDHDAP